MTLPLFRRKPGFRSKDVSSADAEIFVRLAGMRSSPRTRSGVQNLDSRFRGNDEKDACHSQSFRLLNWDGQTYIIFENALLKTLALGSTHIHHFAGHVRLVFGEL